MPTLLRGSVAALAIVVCAGCGGSTPDVWQYRAELGVQDSEKPGARTLAQLDIDRSGRTNEADARVFTELVERARRAAVERGVALGVEAGLYHGQGLAGIGDKLNAQKDGRRPPSVFKKLAAQASLQELSALELRELAIEAQWLAGQARLATLDRDAAQDKTVGGMLSELLPGYSADAMTPAQLCAAIDRAELDGFAAAGLTPVVVTDLDSTVWQGNISDALLAVIAHQRLARPESNAPLRAFLKTLAAVDAAAIDANDVHANAALLLERALADSRPRAERVGAKEAFEQTVSLLRGLDEATVRGAAKAAFEQGGGAVPAYASCLYTDGQSGCGAKQLLDKLAARGVKVYLLSATLHVLAQEAGRQLGVPPAQVLGSPVGIRDGVYTGEVVDTTYYSKGEVLRQWAGIPPLLAFGDSPTSDVPMMIEAVGAGVMVNPRPDLLARDAAEGGRFVGLTYSGTVAKP